MTYILIVEDDPLIREMITTYLTASGFSVHTASDGVQALLMVRTVQPALIVMDMGLPKLNGWQTTQRLRARQDTAQIPIIALTAYALDNDRQRALSVGCDAFETKPIDFASLIATINTLLQRAGPHA
jgi:two-component system, cell cycle response regulator DivK